MVFTFSIFLFFSICVFIYFKLLFLKESQIASGFIDLESFWHFLCFHSPPSSYILGYMALKQGLQPWRVHWSKDCSHDLSHRQPWFGPNKGEISFISTSYSFVGSWSLLLLLLLISPIQLYCCSISHIVAVMLNANNLVLVFKPNTIIIISSWWNQL